MTATAFTDPSAHHRLYADPGRLTQRTSALHAAKVSGADAAATIAGLIAEYQPHARLVADIGCGRGTTTLHLCQRLPCARVIGIDKSATLLDTARRRHAAAGTGAGQTVCADFHQMPVRDAYLHAAVAAFCVYHSRRPDTVVAEIARCLVPGGVAVLVTKSVDSYRELDIPVTAAGLDFHATSRRSLYATFHTGNAARIVAGHLRLLRVEHQRHVFRFADLIHLATYLATTPTYRITTDLADHPDRLADALRASHISAPITATSTVTYVVATRA